VGQDRINEAISLYARGTNVAVDVDYGTAAGNGARQTTMHTYSSGNPYKSFRDGAFRPPIYPLDARLPLSRMRYLEPAVSTNPTVPVDSANPTLSTNIDRAQVTSTVNAWTNTSPVQAQPSLSYRVALPGDIFPDGMVPDPSHSLRANEKVLQGSWSVSKSAPTYNDAHVTNLHREVTPTGAIILTPLTASTSTNPQLSVGLSQTFDASHKPTAGTLKSTNKQLILDTVKPNFALVVYDSSTGKNVQISGTTKDKQAIAVQAALGNPLALNDRVSGQPIKLKEYRWQVIQSPVGGSDALVIMVTPDNDITQQKLRDLTLVAKVSAGAVSSAVHNMNSGAANSYWEGVQSLQARSTNADVIHTPGASMFKSSAAESTTYQGGTSINDRQSAANIVHGRKEARKARAGDVREGGMMSSSSMTMDQPRVLRLRKGGREAVQV
jgi:hypothetical protein